MITLNTKITGIDLIPKFAINKNYHNELYFITVKELLDSKRMTLIMIKLKLERFGELSKELKDSLEYRESLNNLILN